MTMESKQKDKTTVEVAHVQGGEPPRSIIVVGAEEDTFAEFFREQREWSYLTFGPRSHRGPQGPLDHLLKEISKELLGPEGNLKDLEEYADAQFLLFDAVHRAGFTYAELVAACFLKLDKNRGREWPDWRTADPTKAVEHVRKEDEKK